MNASNDDESREHAANVEWLRRAKSGSILRGVLLVAGGHAVACFVVASVASLMGGHPVALMWIVYLGVTQLAHVLPLAVWMHRKGPGRTLQGIWIGAGITALLNAACFGIVVAGRFV